MIRFAFLILIATELGSCAKAPLAKLRGPNPKQNVECAKQEEGCALQTVVSLTQNLLRFQTIASKYPGRQSPAFKKMAKYLKDYASDHDLSFNRIKGIDGSDEVWEITAGSGPRLINFIAHADVAPVSHDASRRGWMSKPFEPTLVGNKLFGRGAQDNKGPIAVALVVLQELKRHELQGEITLVIGTNKEHPRGWEGMKRYAANAPKARYNIGIDSAFPIVIAESGRCAWQWEIPKTTTLPDLKRPTLIDIRGGQLFSEIPNSAMATFIPQEGVEPRHLQRRIQAALERVRQRASTIFPTEISVNTKEKRVYLKTGGSTHQSSEADNAYNALWTLAEISAELDLANSSAKDMLGLLQKYFVGEHYGRRLGIDFEDALASKLLISPTLLESTEQVFQLSLNLQYPAGQSEEEFQRRLNQALKTVRADFPRLEQSAPPTISPPLKVEASSYLAQTLLNIYRKQSGQPDAEAITSRRETYAKLFGAVSFGPVHPNTQYRGHQPAEYITTQELQFHYDALLEASLNLNGAQ